MLSNYLKIALRNVRRQPGYAAINIVGLATGIAVCLLIFLWVQDEWSYDRFHEEAGNIYRVLWDARFGDNEWTLPIGPVPVGTVLEESFPEVEAITQMMRQRRTVQHEGNAFDEPQFWFVRDGFFDVFTVEFVAGDAAALEQTNSVVLTTETAERYFGDQDPIGQTLELGDGTLLQVFAVVNSFPPQSHFHFDFLAPIESLPLYEQRREMWGAATAFTYLRVQPGTDVAGLETRLQQQIDALTEADPASGNYSRYPLQALTSIYLGPDLELDVTAGGNATYVYLFALIGLFILLLACINYVNLTTARSTKRAREVGVRKTVGSSRRQLVTQFLAESIFFAVLAIALAALLVVLALPSFNGLTGLEIEFFAVGTIPTLLLLLGIALGVALLAGSYPALLLSSYKPAAAIDQQGGATSWRSRFRNGLVVFQFSVSIVLIVGTLVMHDQLGYIQSKDLGFDREHVLVVEGASLLGDQTDVFMRELEARPEVVKAAGTFFPPGYQSDSMPFEPEQPANYETTSLSYNLGDPDLVETLGLRIIEGRNFSREMATDESVFLINEAAVRALGWSDPIGRELSTSGGQLTGPVVGVVEDFHHQSLHHEVEPMVFLPPVMNPARIVVRVRPEALSAAVASVESVWKAFAPQEPFRYAFLDDQIEALYLSEQRVATLFNLFAVLAVLIACLGLFGLAAYAAERRTKEIGIRKVMGATSTHVVALLSKDFVRLVVIAFVVAIPVSYYGMNRWLDDFAHRTELDYSVFILAGFLALVIALATVSYHALRAAYTDPARSLRYE